MPATFSNWIQRAGRAARGRARTGLAILIAERTVFNTDLVTEAAPSTTAVKPGAKKKKRKDDDDLKAAETMTKPDSKETRAYAIAHGLNRGGSQMADTPPAGLQPLLNPDSADEGLLTFIQSVTCRRKVWAEAFESPMASKSTFGIPADRD